MPAPLTRSLEKKQQAPCYPILADERHALSHGAFNLREQLAEAVAQPRVPKLASTNLSISHLSRIANSLLPIEPLIQPHRDPRADQVLSKELSARNHK
ncbi:hypothetical protein ACFFWD_03585 [Bradyrhizobium erythrophlei]|uniref:hypothetical protein n=1 Tax=Bradyrhizobium erythrophlei TaxID=1437360 RepID=UPI0035ECA67A